MDMKFIEATHDQKSGNWGKFLLMRFGPDEWAVPSAVAGDLIPNNSLLRLVGWNAKCLLVFDLQTGEGARFLPGGHAKADLDKHRVWVCPMFEPFLEWLYTQDVTRLSLLPSRVELPHAPFAFRGYRRPGPEEGSDPAPKDPATP